MLICSLKQGSPLMLIQLKRAFLFNLFMIFSSIFTAVKIPLVLQHNFN